MKFLQNSCLSNSDIIPVKFLFEPAIDLNRIFDPLTYYFKIPCALFNFINKCFINLKLKTFFSCILIIIKGLLYRSLLCQLKYLIFAFSPYHFLIYLSNFCVIYLFLPNFSSKFHINLITRSQIKFYSIHNSFL